MTLQRSVRTNNAFACGRSVQAVAMGTDGFAVAREIVVVVGASGLTTKCGVCHTLRQTVITHASVLLIVSCEA